jgi:hypothetical protein
MFILPLLNRPLLFFQAGPKTTETLFFYFKLIKINKKTKVLGL